MKIEKLKIHNWRSIADEEIVFNDMVILIGQNNCGKSNIISSLLFFFGTIAHNSLDFHHNSNELFVEVTFFDLDEFDQNQFKKYLSPEGKICVRKTVNEASEVTYNGYVFSALEDYLQDDATSLKREDAEKTPLKEYLPVSGRLTKEMVRSAQEEYIKLNINTLEFHYKLETSNFLGVKSVAKGIFGEVYFIPAVKNASDEFKTTGTTIFNQLFSQIITKMSLENTHYKKAREQMQALTQILNKTNSDGEENLNRPSEIKSLESNLEAELKKWNTTIDIEITPPNIEDLLKVNTNIWVDDGKRTDIGRKGHGLQRSMIFALIKSWATFLKAERIDKEDDGTGESAKPKRRASESTYFFFEEPELFLHPQAQKELYASLKELSKADYQVILCTHSSSFLDLEDYKSIAIVNKTDSLVGTKIKQYTSELFEADEKTNFNLIYWLNPERSELFFATKVILVEGPTDKTIIPKLAKQLDVFRFDYSIIECGGKDNLKLYIKLLNNFSISYIAVYDKDHQADKGIDAKNSADISSAKIEEAIDSEIGASIIFQNDIEEEIGITDKNNKNKPFIALTEISKEGFVASLTLKAKIVSIYK